MGDCSSNNCNPCGPDYNAINQLAVQTKSYARQALSAVTTVEEFQSLYLGAKATAPTTDNEGNPLQVGALYFNTTDGEIYVWAGSAWEFFGQSGFYLGPKASDPTTDNEGNPLVAGLLYFNTVSNTMRVYNGISWQDISFNQTTPFLATGTTAARNLVTRFADVVNVKDFGAVGDGVADDTAAIQLAINYTATFSPKQKTIYIPAGIYLISQTINVNSQVEIIGDGVKQYGTRIIISPTLNNTAFNITTSCKFSKISIFGTFNILNTNEILFYVNGTNNVIFSEVNFYNSYISIYYGGGTTPIFYSSINNCHFQNTKNYFIVINNDSTAGVDLIIDNTRFLGEWIVGAFNFQKGLGSIIATSVMFSETSGTTPYSSTAFLCGEKAPLYGGMQWSNCVFEGGTFSLIGTSSQQWGDCLFSNCLFTSDVEYTLKLKYVSRSSFSNCVFSSKNADCKILLLNDCDVSQIQFINCKYEGIGPEKVYKTEGQIIRVRLFISQPYWGGSGEFIDFTTVPSIDSSKIMLDIIGGVTGGGVGESILLSDYKNTNKIINTRKTSLGPKQYANYTGILDSSGAAIIPHGITGGQSRIVTVEAYYKGAFGEARVINEVYIDGFNIQILNSSAANKEYRCFVEYFLTTIVW